MGLAVRPLERMLGIVRDIATKIFQCTSKACADDEEDKKKQCVLINFIIANFAGPGMGYIQSTADEEKLARFTTCVSMHYKPNPFHNFSHAVDVVHGCSRILRLIESDEYLSELDQFALLICAVAHD